MSAGARTANSAAPSERSTATTLPPARSWNDGVVSPPGASALITTVRLPSRPSAAPSDAHALAERRASASADSPSESAAFGNTNTHPRADSSAAANSRETRSAPSGSSVAEVAATPSPRATASAASPAGSSGAAATSSVWGRSTRSTSPPFSRRSRSSAAGADGGDSGGADESDSSDARPARSIGATASVPARSSMTPANSPLRLIIPKHSSASRSSKPSCRMSVFAAYTSPGIGLPPYAA